MSEASDRIRKMFAAGDKERDAGLESPADVERYDDIVYGSDGKWQVLDVYRPRDSKGKNLPVIISFHGGGWVYGNKEAYQFYCMSLAQRGFAVINFTYRLAPEHKFPAPLEDMNLVVKWMLISGEKYGMDTRYVFAVGDSAGAHQLSLYAAACTNCEYRKKYPFEIPEGFALTAIALNCGAYEIAAGDDPEKLTNELMEDYLADGGTHEELWMVNTPNHITENFPPTFYMTCTGDFLMEEIHPLEKKLLEKKVPHEFHFYGDSKHELGHVFHCNIRQEDAARCNTDECNFFKQFIK